MSEDRVFDIDGEDVMPSGDQLEAAEKRIAELEERVAAFNRVVEKSEWEKLQARAAQAERERDEAQSKLRWITNEIDCRVEHGADSNGHLEAILAKLKGGA